MLRGTISPASKQLKHILFEVQHALVTHSGELLAHGAPVH